MFKVFWVSQMEWYTLFPKGEFLRTHRVGPLGFSYSLHLGLFLKFSPPTNRAVYLVGVVVGAGGGAYFIDSLLGASPKPYST